jgi:hypothetical protein
MEIKPEYVTFEQSKLLKEKEFDEACTQFYREDEKLEFVQYYDSAAKNSVFNLEDTWFSGRKEFKPIAAAPEQHIVVEWLRIKHNIWVDVSIDQFSKPKNLQWMYSIVFLKDCTYSHSPKSYNSPQEAYSAAFDYILKQII